MKIPYSFSVLRYIHDIVTGEFINVGVVLYAPKARFLGAICTSSHDRLSRMFLNISGDHFLQVSRYIQAKLEEEGEKLSTQLPFDKLPVSVLEFTTKVLPPDDSSLQFSPEGYGLTENPRETLEQLYSRYVEEHYEKPEKLSRGNVESITKTKRCPFCGIFVPEDAKFCTTCLRFIDKKPTQPEVKSKKVG